MKAWLALKHTTGIHIQHTRDIKLCNVFGTQSFVVISDDQSTKHRVTLFHYVVSSSATPSVSSDIIATKLLQAQKYKKNLV